MRVLAVQGEGPATGAGVRQRRQLLRQHLSSEEAGLQKEDEHAHGRLQRLLPE